MALKKLNSKRHKGMPYTYWWDITPKQKSKLSEDSTIVFSQKESGWFCHVAVSDLWPLLTESRQSTRGEGNWGIKIMKGEPSVLVVESPRSDDTENTIRVDWISRD